MRRVLAVPRRTVIFIGLEGRSEEAFVRFLQRCCDGQKLSVHLSVSVAGGGDSLAVVRHAGRCLERSVSRRDVSAKLVLLDADRVEEDRRARRDPATAADGLGLQLVYLRPNLEGLLYRFHAGHEARNVVAREALRALRSVWPEYRKPPTAGELSQRFTLADMRRAARHDPQLEQLLDVVGVSSGAR